MDGAPLALLGIIFGAYWVGAALGFGTSILVVTFGAQLYPIDTLLPVVVPLNIGLTSYLALRYRRHTDWRRLLRRILPLVGLGIPVGLALFHLREVGFLRVAFGLFVFLLAGLQLRRALRPHEKEPNLPPKLGAGLLCGGGLVHGLFGTGGPLIVYVVGRDIEDKAVFRSTLATMWIPLNSALLIDYLVEGLYTPSVVRTLSFAVAPVVAGLVLGELTHRRLDQGRFKLAVWGLLFAGGIVLTVRAVVAMA